MSSECCCPSCDARMIELIQAIDDLRRSLVIAIQEVPVSRQQHLDDSRKWKSW